jgi:hypothetical protein
MAGERRCPELPAAGEAPQAEPEEGLRDAHVIEIMKVVACFSSFVK